MISPSDFYRDNFFLKFINGKTVPEEENIPVEPPKCLSDFISFTGSTPLARIQSYPKHHPAQNVSLQQWIDEHRILSKSSNPNSVNGKGFDFLQAFQ